MIRDNRAREVRRLWLLTVMEVCIANCDWR